MASSNRHWPSMFKSKPHQWQHEVNSSLISNGSCHRSSSSSYSSEERTPEPKPRWNPRPEQIRILESIFDSGMVNPPREEIKKIRAQLQEYGQVGDANVFYWFQNRKSRSKHKLRNLHNSSKQQQQRHQTPPPATTTVAVAPSSSSSSSSENKSSPRNGLSKSVFTLGPSNMDVSNFSLSPPPPYFPITQENGILAEPFSFQGNGFLLPEGFGGSVQYGGGQPVVVGPCGTNFMLSEMMNHTDHVGGATKKVKTMATTATDSTTATAAVTSAAYSSVAPSSTPSCASVSPPTVTVPFLSSITTTHHHHHQLHATARTTTNVFINEVAFEVVANEPFNVRATFGDEAVLVNASGHAVLTDEWGVTLHPLHPGSFYYLIW